MSLLRHPSLLLKKAVGRIRRRLVRLPTGAVRTMINSRVTFEHRFEPFLNEDDFRAMLTNSYDTTLCEFLKNSLAPGDIFIDVGANVGYISAVAASYVGTSGEIHAFEPLKECFVCLRRLVDLNPQLKLVANNMALGQAAGSLPISYNPNGDSRNATLVPGHDYPATYEVAVMRLDDYIFRSVRTPERIAVIKIDVEGYEYPVLRGLERVFSDTPIRPLIVCEVKPWEIARLGGTLEVLDQFMSKFSYHAYDMLQHDKRVDITRMNDLEVVLFRA